MSHLSPGEIDEILAMGIERYTPTTVTDLDSLKQEVSLARERGFAVNSASWWRPGVAAVAAALVDTVGRPYGALVVSIPEFRFRPETAAEFGRWTADAAAEISSGYGGPLVPKDILSR